MAGGLMSYGTRMLGLTVLNKVLVHCQRGDRIKMLLRCGAWVGFRHKAGLPRPLLSTFEGEVRRRGSDA